MKTLTPEDLDGMIAQKKPLDKVVGRAVRTYFGPGKVVKMAPDGRIRVKVRLYCCAAKRCRNYITAYLRSSVHFGAWCVAENGDGKTIADLRDQVYICKKHQGGKQR